MRALPYGETVTIVRPGPPTQDAYGNDVPGPPTEIEVAGAAVAPRTSSEDLNARDQVIVGLTVYLPPGTIVQPTDRMRVRGELYEVEGEPGTYLRSPFTGLAGPVEVASTKVSG